ncbi:MAG: 2-oxoacid:acceptor oxidoreductase family protein [Thermodesulfovibrionales bacterium]
MTTKLIIAGSGGQGILFLGKILAFAAAAEKKEVTWFPSYGAEMRGGAANCTVIISDEMIGSPVVQNPDILIAMNSISLGKYQQGLRRHGYLLYDSSLIIEPVLRSDIVTVPVPATEVASSVLTTKSANMVMLGALLARTRLLKFTSLTEIFEDPESPYHRASEINVKAFQEGVSYIENTKG